MARSGPPALLTIVLATVATRATPPPVRDGGSSPPGGVTPTALRFEIAAAPGLIDEPESGRLFVVLGRRARPEPRLGATETGLDASPIVAHDVTLGPGRPGILDARAATSPIADLAALPPGAYHAQAVFDRSDDLRSLNAPGNLVGEPVAVRIDPRSGGTVKLELSRRLPDEVLPPDTNRVKYLTLPSKLLSAFHGRPMFLRAGVILPRDFDRDPDRLYPLRVHIGGFGARSTSVGRMMAPGSSFRAAWDADDAPRMVLLHLDGAGPLGDPYQVNSANHGPYGDAITTELIPLVESRFRGSGARVLDGGSTGGWVALALQVFYPDFFSGAWSFCPDAVDFRSFQLVNIYDDANAYVNAHGFERPAARDVSGDVRYTMRHECLLENALGRGDSWALSGGQWGSWNATFGPRGEDGLPVPLWDPRSGAINQAVVEHWKTYDLRLILQKDWPALAPRLQGKLHIWVGEADDYFLNNAVHRLDAFLSTADPPYHGSITYGPGRGHCWMGIGEREMMDQMASALRLGEGDRRPITPRSRRALP